MKTPGYQTGINNLHWARVYKLGEGGKMISVCDSIHSGECLPKCTFAMIIYAIYVWTRGLNETWKKQKQKKA